MSGLWFVTPAWQRVGLTAVCLEQRRRVIGELAAAGVEAHCVVVADDENLDTARALGFDTVERRNDAGLGRKFNDGMEHAAREGAEWIVPIGSDSWIMARYLLPLPHPRQTRTSQLYAVADAGRLGSLRVRTASGAGPYVFHRSLLEGCGFRPAEDALMRGIDHSTIRGIGRTPPWTPRDVDRLQYVGFRGVPTISPYERLFARWGEREWPDPWSRLASAYPADLVAAARRAIS